MELPSQLKSKVEQESERLYGQQEFIECIRAEKCFTAGASYLYNLLLSDPSLMGISAGRWKPVTKEQDCPPNDEGEDYPREYLLRCKGDDPRSGWVAVMYRTAAQMWYAVRQFEYAEYLDETSATSTPNNPLLVEALKKIERLTGAPILPTFQLKDDIFEIATTALKTIEP